MKQSLFIIGMFIVWFGGYYLLKDIYILKEIKEICIRAIGILLIPGFVLFVWYLGGDVLNKIKNNFGSK